MSSINFSVSEEDMTAADKPRLKFGPGNYKFRVGTAEIKESSAGTTGIKLTLFADHDDKEFKVFDAMWLTDKAKWKFIRVLKSLELEPEKYPITCMEDVQNLCDMLEGLEGTFRLKYQKDSMYTEPGEYYSPEAAKLESLGPFPVKETASLDSGDDDMPF